MKLILYVDILICEPYKMNGLEFDTQKKKPGEAHNRHLWQRELNLGRGMWGLENIVTIPRNFISIINI